MDDKTLTIERTFDAPIKLVWETWTQPKHIAEWWGRGMGVQIEEHDFSVGGKWKFVMPMPDGSQFISEGVYSEIIELQKIVSTAEFRPMTEGVIFTALFKEYAGKTQFTFSVLHPSEDYRQQQEQMGFFNGWGSVFNTLEKYLQTV